MFGQMKYYILSSTDPSCYAIALYVWPEIYIWYRNIYGKRKFVAVRELLRNISGTTKKESVLEVVSSTSTNISYEGGKRDFIIDFIGVLRTLLNTCDGAFCENS